MLQVREIISAIVRGPQHNAIRRDGSFESLDRRRIRNMQRQVEQANRNCRIDPGADSGSGFFKRIVDFLARAFG